MPRKRITGAPTSHHGVHGGGASATQALDIVPPASNALPIDGPWEVHTGTPQAMRRCTLGDAGWTPLPDKEIARYYPKGQFVCVLYMGDEPIGDMRYGNAICALSGELNDVQTRALAQLLCAAPRLLEATQTLVAAVQTLVDTCGCGYSASTSAALACGTAALWAAGGVDATHVQASDTEKSGPIVP